MDSETVLLANPESSFQRVSGELSISLSSMIRHLPKLGKNIWRWRILSHVTKIFQNFWLIQVIFVPTTWILPTTRHKLARTKIMQNFWLTQVILVPTIWILPPTRHKLAPTKILQNFWLTLILNCVYFY